MTFDRARHEAFEELISASLHDDISDSERRRLDAHLDTCPQCRTTLAAFAEQRRIMAGLRHVAPPRDLHARVRGGIERGAGVASPWWRRPPAIFAGVGGSLAVVAGALLGLVILADSAEDPVVGNASPTPSQFLPSLAPTMQPTLPPLATPAESVAAPEPTATPLPEPTATPLPTDPEPDVVLAVTGAHDNLTTTIRDPATNEPIAEVGAPTYGPPIAAQLSPDGEWLAHMTQIGSKGTVEVRLTRLGETAETFVLLESEAERPFAKQLAWSPDGDLVAFTVVDPDGDGTDVWVFDTTTTLSSRLTDAGNVYAGSWVAGEDGSSLLWLSVADEEPRSYLRRIESGDAHEVMDLDDGPYPAATNVFQPLVSPNGAFVIYWTGRMEQVGDEWAFVEGGRPWLAENKSDGELGYRFTSSRELFSDLAIGRDAFTSAAITWGGDSDSLAVWSVEWAGISQGTEGRYPDPGRVYFGHATDPRGLTQYHAIDAADLPDDAFVVDVKVAPTGRHLLVTAGRPLPGDLSPPQADLLLITRNTGLVPDEVETLGSASEGWFGPAAFDAD